VSARDGHGRRMRIERRGSGPVLSSQRLTDRMLRRSRRLYFDIPILPQPMIQRLPLCPPLQTNPLGNPIPNPSSTTTFPNLFPYPFPEPDGFPPCMSRNRSRFFKQLQGIFRVGELAFLPQAMTDGEPVEGPEEGDKVEDFTGSSDLSGDVDTC